MSKNLDDLTITELNNLAEKLHEEIMDLYDKEDNEDIYTKIEEKIRFFNEVFNIFI